MSSARYPTCCPGLLANQCTPTITVAVAVVTVWIATASMELSAAESPTASVGPASCEQPQPADAIRTLGGATLEDAPSWESIQLVADWQEQINCVRWLLGDNEQAPIVGPRLADARGANVVTDDETEEVEVGKAERDPCYTGPLISTVRADIAAGPGMFPEDIAAQCRAVTSPIEDARMVGGWKTFDKHWSATCMKHRPLYFEETNAERYGHTPGYCIQPFVSAGHFLATIPTLPFQMWSQPPCECTYTLGQYRPGSCVPYRYSRLPWRIGAGSFEAGIIVGLVALIP